MIKLTLVKLILIDGLGLMWAYFKCSFRVGVTFLSVFWAGMVTFKGRKLSFCRFVPLCEAYK